MRVFWLVLWPQMRWLRAQNWPHWSVLMYIHKLNSFPTAQKHLGWQRQAMASTDLQGAKWGPWRALRAPHMHFNEFVGVAHLEQGLFDPIPWRKTLETGRYWELLKAPPSITSLTHCVLDTEKFWLSPRPFINMNWTPEYFLSAWFHKGPGTKPNFQVSSVVRHLVEQVFGASLPFFRFEELCDFSCDFANWNLWTTCHKNYSLLNHDLLPLWG